MTVSATPSVVFSKPPPVPRSRRTDAGWVWLLLAAAVVTALVTLFLIEPRGQSFYPQCGLYVVTGLACPGCGGLRAAHQLLHGNVRDAFALNPLIFVLLTTVAGLLLNQAGRKALGRPWVPSFQHRAWIWLLVTFVVVFTVARNIPVLDTLNFSILRGAPAGDPHTVAASP